MTILEVYQRYQHLDHLLSDFKWLPGKPLGPIINDLWQTIRTRAIIEAATQSVQLKLKPPQHIQRHPQPIPGPLKI